MPNGIPRYVRIYDKGPDGPADRYTVVYTGNYGAYTGNLKLSVSMSENPTHPQGVVGREETHGASIDSYFNKWARKIGSKHPDLGTRIEFTTLPEACQALTLRDYKEIWNI